MPRTGTLAALVAALLLAAGCAPEKGGRDAGTGPAQSPEPGGTAIVSLPADPDVLNSLLSGSAYAGQILSLMQAGLVEMGEDLAPKPRIARDWSWSADSLAITFRLRPWRWEDGAPLTARDVASSFALFASPVVGSPRRGGLSGVTTVDALDDSTVRYHLGRRRPDALFSSLHAILPAHVTDGLDPALVRGWPLNERPLASAEFALERWLRGRELVLVRNGRYPGSPALLDRIVFRIIPDETSRLVELEAGGVDFVDEIPPHAAARLAGASRVTVQRCGGRLVGHLQWNLRRPQLADKRVRRALSLAIDRSAFVDGLLCGYGRPAGSPLPPLLSAHDSTLAPDPYDPASARALLAAAGWRDRDGDGIVERDGRPLSLLVVTRKGDPVRENGLAVIRANLRAVGAEVRGRVLEFGAALDEVRQGRFDAYLGVYSARMWPDPSGLLRSDATDRFNYGGYASAAADSLLDAAMACADPREARALWSRYQRLVAEDAPIAFIYYPDTLSGVSRRLRGVRTHVLSPFNNAAQWWIAPADR